MAQSNGRVVVLALRIIQVILALIVLGLISYVANWWMHDYHHLSSSQINFLIFDSIWTLLVLIYLIVVPWRYSDTRAHHKFAILGVEAVTMLFWFAGFIAEAVFVNDRPCWGRVCNAAKAASAFAALEWLAFAATTAMAVMHVLRTRNRNDRGKADPNLNIQEGV